MAEVALKKKGEKGTPSSSNLNPTDAEVAKLRLAAIVDSSDDAIVSKDLDGTILSWNAAATRMFGYQPAEIIGKSIYTIIPPSLHHEEDEVLRRLRAGERIDHYETVRRRKDGSYVDVSLTISPLKDRNGRVIGASKIARDISDRRRGDEERFRLAAIVESSDDAIVSKDLEGTITSWNAAATRLFGWKPEEAIGHSILMIIPDDLQAEERNILRRLQNGERIEHFETVRKHKDGYLVEVSVATSPVKDRTGRVIGASKIARDISGQKRMQQALIESEKLAATGRLAAAIAHEINNPLEAVTNLAYLLSMDSSLSETAHRYAELMLQEISRANEITKQTLAFYRDTGRPSEVHIQELVENVLELNRPRIRNKKIMVEREFRTADPIYGLAAEIRQVIANLLLNAMDAVPEGGVIRVRLADDVVPQKHRIRLTIADKGHGIPAENRKRMFEPFFTTKGNQGTGLGLWVSRGIVEKHGGRIQVRSCTRPERSGTAFSVVLPKNPPKELF
jgi:PAS domain S-box-containing protein